MLPESQFGGHDPLSMAADNTSGFNCRRAVASGPPQWSVHAYGEAIDVNPVQNPYVFNGIAQPVAGAAYMNRANVRPGMAELGGVLNDAFASVGWYWEDDGARHRTISTSPPRAASCRRRMAAGGALRRARRVPPHLGHDIRSMNSNT